MAATLPLLYTHVMGSHGFPSWFWTALDKIKASGQIAFAQSGIPCRAVSLERDNQDSAFNGKFVVAHDPARQRNVLSGQADVTATNLTVAN